MEKICNAIQEEIVWGKTLTEDFQEHILSCLDCNQIAMGFSKLDSLIHQHLSEVEVPEGFAERVMSRIAASPMIQSADWALRLSGWFDFILGLRPIQIGLAYMGAIFAFGNFVRFILAVILPSTA
jgi:hypothetical protein